MSYNNQYQSNPYGTPNPYEQGPPQEAGYGYGQQTQEQHELEQYSHPYGEQPAPVAHVLSQQDFLARVANVRNDIRSLTADVQQIAQLHQRALTSSEGSAQSQLENLVANTQLKNTSIRDQIRSLKLDAERTTDGSKGLKTRQFDSLTNDFKKEIQGYLAEEQQYQERYRDQIARQFRIVNPDATEEQVSEAVQTDWGNEGIFQQALRTNRSGQASAVLGNVRARHNELQKIEQSIAELAGLFQDLDTLIVQQDAVVARAEEQTEQTNVNLHKGNEEVSTGIKHARRRNRLKWWCALVVFLIIVAIALGVGLGVYFSNKH